MAKTAARTTPGTRTQSDHAGRSTTARATLRPAVAGIPVSHPDRLIYPELGISKIDLARYYESIAKWMLPHQNRRFGLGDIALASAASSQLCCETEEMTKVASRCELIAHFTYFETPDDLGGDGEEHSLVLTSAVAKRGRPVDPRTAAYEWLIEHISAEDVFDRSELKDVLEWSGETMGGNVAAVTSTRLGFELLQDALHRAGYLGVTLAHSSENLLSYLE